MELDLHECVFTALSERWSIEMCMGMGIPWEWKHKYAKNGNGNGKSTSDSGNGNGYFFMCATIPIGRLDANAIQ